MLHFHWSKRYAMQPRNWLSLVFQRFQLAYVTEE